MMQSKVATAVDANLIVMGSHRRQPSCVMFSWAPQSSCKSSAPARVAVLMVNNEVAQGYTSVLNAHWICLTHQQTLCLPQRSLGMLDDAQIYNRSYSFDAIAKSKLALADVTEERIVPMLRLNSSEAISELQDCLTSLSSRRGRMFVLCRGGRSSPSHIQGNRRDWTRASCGRTHGR